jgi:hypothetical protein
MSIDRNRSFRVPFDTFETHGRQSIGGGLSVATNICRRRVVGRDFSWVDMPSPSRRNSRRLRAQFRHRRYSSL